MPCFTERHPLLFLLFPVLQSLLTNYSFDQYRYDARGNMLTSAHNDGMGGYNQISFSYDARNQLTAVDYSDPMLTDSSYAYDHDGRRIQSTITPYGSPAITTDYLWDEFSQYGDVALESDGTNTTAYTLANNMVLSQTTNGITNYLLPDAQNSTRAVSNTAGNITSNYDYDAFGNLQGTPSLETNYLYTGQQYDVTSELYSLRARYYDPMYGRFLSRDTWAYDYQNPVELNRYVYTANNPATWIDPSGYGFNIGGYTISAGTAAKVLVTAAVVGTLILFWIRQLVAPMQINLLYHSPHKEGQEQDTGENTGTDGSENTDAGAIAGGSYQVDSNPCVTVYACSQPQNQNNTQPTPGIGPWMPPATFQPPTAQPTQTPDPCSEQKIRQLMAGRKPGPIVLGAGPVGNIRSGEKEVVESAVIGWARDMCLEQHNQPHRPIEPAQYFRAAPGLTLTDRILSDGNNRFVASRLMNYNLQIIKSPSPFAILETQEDIDYYYDSKFDWPNVDWE